MATALPSHAEMLECKEINVSQVRETIQNIGLPADRIIDIISGSESTKEFNFVCKDDTIDPIFLGNQIASFTFIQDSDHGAMALILKFPDVETGSEELAKWRRRAMAARCFVHRCASTPKVSIFRNGEFAVAVVRVTR